MVSNNRHFEGTLLSLSMQLLAEYSQEKYNLTFWFRYNDLNIKKVFVSASTRDWSLLF